VTIPALLLTGGESRRMGTDKAAIHWCGETLATRAARVLAEVCDPVVEVGPGYTSLPAVREEPPGSGPVQALLAGVDALGARGPVLLLACDLPRVDAPLLRLLADRPGEHTVMAMHRDRAQYACARYGPVWLAAARATRATSFARVPDGDVDYLMEPEWHAVAPARALDDVDTPEDLARSIRP
jgi:molybdopterin-guanine dinucleotide biosynthesis protein A